MAHLAKEPNTKEKLNSIVQGFDDFDTEMRRGTRVSRTDLYIIPFLCISMLINSCIRSS